MNEKLDSAKMAKAITITSLLIAEHGSNKMCYIFAGALFTAENKKDGDPLEAFENIRSKLEKDKTR